MVYIYVFYKSQFIIPTPYYFGIIFPDKLSCYMAFEGMIIIGFEIDACSFTEIETNLAIFPS